MTELDAIDQESAILSRVISPAEGGLSRQAAEAILAMKFPQSDIARMNELSQKNRQGMATANDLSEMEHYSRVGALINLLHLKARRSLANG